MASSPPPPKSTTRRGRCRRPSRWWSAPEGIARRRRGARQLDSARARGAVPSAPSAPKLGILLEDGVLLAEASARELASRRCGLVPKAGGLTVATHSAFWIATERRFVAGVVHAARVGGPRRPGWPAAPAARCRRGRASPRRAAEARVGVRPKPAPAKGAPSASAKAPSGSAACSASESAGSSAKYGPAGMGAGPGFSAPRCPTASARSAPPPGPPPAPASRSLPAPSARRSPPPGCGCPPDRSSRPAARSRRRRPSTAPAPGRWPSCSCARLPPGPRRGPGRRS